MSIFTLLGLALSLLDYVVAQTENNVDDQVVSSIKAAVEEVRKVHGLPVTKEQLEG
ncbi:hypothetical protein LCGC14_1706200, partial [marine sediment metagenome]